MSAQEFFLHDGDKVVFFGDSITEQKLYTSDIEDFVLTRYPELKIDFVQSGWGGERVDGGTAGAMDDNLRDDVIAYKPTVVVIMLGMNDGRYKPSSPERIQAYRSGLLHIVNKLAEALPHARIVLLTPSPYDDITREPSIGAGYNQLLLAFGSIVQEIGQAEHLQVVDLNMPFATVLSKLETQKSPDRTLLLPDRIHPSPAGHLLIAEAILHAWHAKGVISSVTIDAGQDAVVRKENAAVSAVWTWGSDLSWTQMDAALPFFVDTRDAPMEHVLTLTDFEQQLNRESLLIQGLPAGTYALWVDDIPIGRFTDAELLSGINMAFYTTPMLLQAAEVHHLTAEHNDVRTIIRRQLHYFYPEDHSVAMDNAVTELKSLEDDVVLRQRSAAKPVRHSFLLRPVAPGNLSP